MSPFWRPTAVSKEEMLQDPVDQKRCHDTRQVTQIIMSPLFRFPSSFCCWCCCKNEAVRHLGVDHLGTHHVSHVRGENTAEAGKGHPRAHGRWPHNSWEDFRSVHVNGCKGNAHRKPANHGKRHHNPVWNNNYDDDNYHIDDDGDGDDDDKKKICSTPLTLWKMSQSALQWQ